MTHPERLAAIIGDVGRIYPGAGDHVTASWSIAWDKERFADGVYPWFAPGEVTAFGSAFRQPCGRIHFAGEQASTRPGWMEGAMAAGQAAARRVIDARAERSETERPSSKR